jgi:superfamily II helicase
MKKATWEAAYINTASKKVGLFSYLKMCKHCEHETKYTATDKRQMLGNAYQRVVICNECNNPFIEQWT